MADALRFRPLAEHGIHCDERQTLMNLVRKLVYAKTEAEFAIEYYNFQNQGPT